ncbi:MAG: DNA-processing protein DprA [Ignavibacteriales bacterium]|nr:DNA-processing protein DprA [Ignavibacteriales bacterium]
MNSPDYSKILKNNMKVSLSPPLLYIKGDKQMLQERSIAVVGSRDASEISFNFTDNVCLNATKEFRVVVSGFAKGVDQRALESTLKVKGRSIIVLPQGIMTFGTGIKKYYPQIVEGDVLVVSTFFPKAPWSVGLAMARNPVIYGLAENIFVAQSSNKGGTWEGVHDGLKRGRKIFVRVSQPGENIANNEFFTKGAIPVDVNGNITKMPEGVIPPSKQNLTLETPSLFGEE